MTRFRTSVTTLAATLGLGASLVLPGAWLSPAQAAAFVCDETPSTSADAGVLDYPGPSASRVYDTRFERGFAIDPQVLRNYVPQGLAVWKNWVDGQDMFLQTAYDPAGGNSIIYGTVAGVGLYMGAIPVAPGHVGGIAVSGRWAFVQGNGTIRRYDLNEVRDRFRNGNPGEYLPYDGVHPLTGGAEADFLASDGGHIYAGKHNADDRDYMYRYAVDPASGALDRGARTRIPKKTQGLAVLNNHFVFATSLNRNKKSNVYVARRGYGDTDAGLEANARCFAAPSMMEGMALWERDGRNRVYAVYESGAYHYNSGIDDPRNPIDHAHWATSVSLVDWFNS